MKLEIYQVGKLPPLTIVECDNWNVEFDGVPRLKCYNCDRNTKLVIAEFFLSNIAGFKKVGADKC